MVERIQDQEFSTSTAHRKGAGTMSSGIIEFWIQAEFSSGWILRYEGKEGWRWNQMRGWATLCQIQVCFHLSCAQSLSCVQLFAILCAVAWQAPLSTGFLKQEYRSGLPFPITAPKIWLQGKSPASL